MSVQNLLPCGNRIKIYKDMLGLYLSLLSLPLVVERMWGIRLDQSRDLRSLAIYIGFRGGFLAKAVFGDTRIGISSPALFVPVPHLGHCLAPFNELAAMDQLAVHRPSLRLGHQPGDQYCSDRVGRAHS
jgi:hypothetical protein